MILSQILAATKNDVIGVSGTLPWDIPEDMQYFKDTTKGHIMIMGRKTFDSFKGPLPKRFHIVISRQDIRSEHPSVIYVKNFEEALKAASLQTEKYPGEVFIVGGGEIYKQTLPQTNKVYLTRIHMEVAGDTKYSGFNESEFKLISKKESRNDHVSYDFLVYQRN